MKEGMEEEGVRREGVEKVKDRREEEIGRLGKVSF